MSFLFVNHINLDFKKLTKKLIWGSCTAAKALSFTSQVKLMNKRKFAKTTLNKIQKLF